RLEADETGLGEPDQRLADRLVGATFGRQGDPGWGRHQDKARVLVASVVQHIEAALDERVVEGADREEPRAEERTGETERRELQKKIAFGDAELDVLTLRRHRPALRRNDLFLAKSVGAFGAVEDPAAVDPRPEIGRNRDIGGGRHDALGERTAGGGNVAEEAAKGFLRRQPRAARGGE